MKLTPIMKSLALAGIISTLPVTSWAETSPKEAAAATKQANDALYKQLPSPITPTLPTRIKVLLPRSYGGD
jgi:hypothetical protein